MKHLFTLALVLTLALSLWSPGLQKSWAADTDTTILLASANTTDGKAPSVKGSVSKGKYYFKKSCKSCHGPKSEAGEVTPLSKTMKQWERYMDKGVHRKIVDGDAKIKEPLLEVAIDDKITAITDESERAKQLEEKLIHIRTFLIHHAADSDQPETCG